MVEVAALRIYPVKSCAGIAYEQIVLDARGFAHDLTNLDRGDIALAIFTPAPHGRLKSQIQIANEKFTLFKLWDFSLVIDKVRFFDHALWPCG